MKLPCAADIIRVLPPGSHTLVVAFSGGPDSSSLIHLALRTERAVRAVHIHHGLCPQADDWADYCQRVCNALGVDLHIEKISPNAQDGGIEASARALRYAAIQATLRQNDCVLTAHHADDQAETLLLRMLRGTGPQGLIGIQPQRPLGKGWLLRPLLGFTRAELDAYRQRHDINGVDDPSNKTAKAERSYLRERVMPALTARWPAAIAHLNRLSQWAAEDTEVLENLLDARLQHMRGAGEGPLPFALWAAESPAMQRALLRRWIAWAGWRPPSGKQLEAGRRSLLAASHDRQPLLTWADGCIGRHQQWLYRLPAKWPAIPATMCLRPGQTLAWGDMGWIEWPATAPMALALRIRPPLSGDKLAYPGRPRQRLKECFRASGVPPWWRARLPVVLDEQDEVLAVLGIHLTERGDQRWGAGNAPIWHVKSMPHGGDWGTVAMANE